MKVFIIFAVTVAFLGVSNAEEDKKTRVMKFWKCITCSENPVVLEDYKKCAELKPEKCRKIAEDCKNEILPGMEKMEERLQALCKSEKGEMEQMYDCIMNHEGRKDLNDEEKTQMKEFIQCAKKIDKKHCDSR